VRVLLEGKSVLFIVAQQNFRDEELDIPEKILKREGAKVVVASITTDEARGMLGMRVKPDIAVRSAAVGNFHAVVIAGGSGSPKLADYPEVLSVVRRFFEKGKLIAAICLAPFVLAKAGILRGVTVTTYAEDFVMSELARAGAIYSDKHIVVDGKIITADGPKAAKEFGEEIVKALVK